MKRRNFMAAAGSTVGALGLGVFGTEEASAAGNEAAGVANTNHHFRLEDNPNRSRFAWSRDASGETPWNVVVNQQFNARYGGVDNCNLNGCNYPFGEPQQTSQNSQYMDFDVEGEIPGLYGRAPYADEKLVIPVHGYRVSEQGFFQDFIPKVDGGLDAHAFDVIRSGFCWDGDASMRAPGLKAIDPMGYMANDWVACYAGIKLAAFIDFYGRNAPNTPIHILAHSMGSRVTLHALAQLYEWDLADRVTGVHLAGAAVPTECVANDAPDSSKWDFAAEHYTLDNKNWPLNKSDKYFDAINSIEGTCHVYYSYDDDVLKNLFYAAVREPALGRHGTDPTIQNPSNLLNVDVSGRVTDHGDYFRPASEGGCMDLIANNLNY
jgi:pimeloyl-ACP methyl ester carboxylesterase